MQRTSTRWIVGVAILLLAAVIGLLLITNQPVSQAIPSPTPTAGPFADAIPEPLADAISQPVADPVTHPDSVADSNADPDAVILGRGAQ